MGIEIEDGTGNSSRAEVDEKHRLHTESVSRSSLSVASEQGIAIGFSTPFLSITTNGGRMLWIRNESTNNLYLAKFWFNWNGGNTNHNRCMNGIMYFNDSLPSANANISGAGSLNTKFNGPGQNDLTVRVWNGTGDGMTIDTPGQAAFLFQPRQGPNYYEMDSAIIIGKDDAISFFLQGEEAGVASINIVGHLGTP